MDIYRVGDKLSDELKISDKIMKTKIASQNKVCNLLEFEILIIINEGLLKDFYKSKLKASEVLKSKIGTNSKQSSFVENYFSKMSNQEILNLLHAYKKIHKNKNNVLCIYDILKI